MKMKLKKIIRTVLLSMVLLIAVALVGILVFTSATVGKAVSRGAAKALGVGVSVKTVKLAPFKGQVTVRDLVIDNPDGYENPLFLTLSQGTVSVNPKQLLAETIHIQQIDLTGVSVVMEQKGLTSNVQEIVDYIHAHSSDDSGKKMVIDLLTISDITVKVKLIPLPGKIDTVPMKLSPITLKHLGEKSALTTAALTSRIILAIAGGIIEQAVGILPDGLVNLAGTAVGTTADVGKTVLKTGAGAGGAVIKGAGKLGGALIGGLLPGTKEEPNAPQE